MHGDVSGAGGVSENYANSFGKRVERKEHSFICKNPALQGKCLTLTFKEVSNERLMNVELRH